MADTTYYVVAFDSQEDGGGKGGNLHIAFLKSVLPKLTFSVDSKGTLDSSNRSVTISGTYTCNADAAINEFTVFVDGRQGDLKGRGEFNGPCDGATHNWTAVVAPEGGKFRAGKIKTNSFGVASNVDQGIAYTIKQTVRLPRAR